MSEDCIAIRNKDFVITLNKCEEDWLVLVNVNIHKIFHIREYAVDYMNQLAIALGIKDRKQIYEVSNACNK